MIRTSLRAKALACTFLATVAVAASPAWGQTQATAPFPVRQYKDANGVDLLSGAFTTMSPQVAIGDADGGLSYMREIRQGLAADNLLGAISVNGTAYTVAIGSDSEVFTLSGSTFTPQEQRGSTLSYDGTNYTYRMSDGTAAVFIPGGYGFGNAPGISLSSITYPSGKTLNFFYTTGSYLAASTPSGPVYVTGRRLQSVTANTGYHMKFTYDSDGISGASGVGTWSHVGKVTGLNDLVDSCATSANSCTPAGTRPSLTISAIPGTDYTDANNNTTHYTYDFSNNGVITGIRRPGSSSDNVTIAYASGKVSSVTADGVATTYAYSDAGSTRTVTVTRGTAPARVYTFDTTKLVLLSEATELGKTTTYDYDTSNRLTKVTAPETNYVSYQYDARGNVKTTTYTPKTGSSLTPITLSATYDTVCANGVTCNKPNSTTDGRGYTTDYTYDSVHGGLSTVTSPAPTTGAVRPQVRLSYTRLGVNGTASSSGVYKLTGASTCQTGSSCAGTADEVVTTIGYGANLLPATVSRGSGTTPVMATMSTGYDAVGNTVSVDGPLAGTADTTVYRYDAMRRVIGTVSADPDGAGPLHNRAVKTTYNAIGQVTKVEQGIVNSQSDADWTGFTSLQEVDTTYDVNARPVTQAAVAGTTTYALTQMSYDALGRPACTAVRMSPTYFGSLPTSACSLGTQQNSPDFGPDRITVTSYDAANRVSTVTSAYGTGAQSDDVHYVYSDNGQVQTVTDAENNKTSYVYDGFDRVVQAFLPSTSKGANASSSVDYEQYAYDENGNVKTRWQRDGLPIGFTWDGLNRVTYKDLPGSDPDTSLTYDLLGRLTGATQGTESVAFSYDALSRKLSETGLLGTTQSLWDAAGRRTRLTWPDATYVDYDHLVTGEVSAVRQNGATSGLNVLATYLYDDLGRATSIARGNGTTTSYGYTGPQLTTIGHVLAGSTYDVQIGLTYNPAGQIATRTLSNNLYAYTGMGSGTLGYAINGLNQVTGVGTTSVQSDQRGNLLSDGTNSYTFSSDNRVTSLSAAPYAPVTLGYDPVGRWIKGSTYMQFGWDGGDMVIEKISGTATKWVHGAGGEPLLREDPDGTWHWMYTDERGSTIASALNSGANEWVTTYDEYGRTGPGHGAYRYGYAGQLLIGSGLSFARNRVYSLNLGRFLQTDPIGYGAGMNMYAYVGADPINLVDPSGLAQQDRTPLTHSACISDCATGGGGVSGWITGPDVNGRRWETEMGYTLHIVWYAELMNLINANPTNDPNGVQHIDVVGTRPRKASPPGPSKAPPPPKPAEPACAMRNMRGMCLYVRGDDGKLKNTREYQKFICDNYARMQDAGQMAADGFTGVGVAGAVSRTPTGGIVGALSTFAGFVSQITTEQGYRPFGVTIIPKPAPPAGCPAH